MHLLVIGCHADDIDLGCAGSMLRFAEQGWDVSALIITDGAAGGVSMIREDEQYRAFSFLNQIKHDGICFFRLPDTKLTQHELIPLLEAHIVDRQPDLVMVNYEDDTHQDHRECALATRAAMRFDGNLLYYQTLTTRNFLPTIFIDITDHVATKTNMILAHESQCTRRGLVDHAMLNWSYNGGLSHTKYAEGFIPERLVY